jgi:hypothetical protein
MRSLYLSEYNAGEEFTGARHALSRRGASSE